MIHHNKREILLHLDCSQCIFQPILDTMNKFLFFFFFFKMKSSLFVLRQLFALQFWEKFCFSSKQNRFERKKKKIKFGV